MRNYRLVLLFKSGLKKAKQDEVFTNVKQWIGEEVKEDKIDNLGEKKLAYPIKREKSAEYMMMSFKAQKVSRDLDKRLTMEEDILRHLLVRD